METAQTFATDNRYAPGASNVTLPPAGITAAYAARWIDKGSARPDVVPDRQGFAYDSMDERNRLAEAMRQDLRQRDDFGQLPREADEPTVLFLDEHHTVALRRSGGYIYVDAWREA